MKGSVAPVDALIFIAVPVLLASLAVIVGTVAFFVWLAQDWGRWLYRRHARSHLYVPVSAIVSRVWLSRGFATLWVSYEFQGRKIDNRLTVSHAVAREAKAAMRVDLEIDPEYPKDVVVAAAFEKQSAVLSGADAFGSPFRAGASGSFRGYTLRLIGVLVLGVGGLGFVWLWRGTIDATFVAVIALVLILLSLDCWLLVRSRLTARRSIRAGRADGGRPEAE